MTGFVNLDAAYDIGTLTDWYISSVSDDSPVWTDEHIEELFNDFYVIPKDTPDADVAPVKHGHWRQVDESKCECSNCGIVALIGLYPHGDKNYCPNCGAKMMQE
ncbi:MAG: hypothetical protein ACLU2K_01675 [Clostridia bacterium]